jgi:hypothetical protein
MITGIGVHDPTDSAFRINWTERSRSNGISVHDPPERAPMPMRHGCNQAMAAFCPAIAPCQVGIHRAFIDENQLRRGQLGLLLTPFDTRLGNVLTLLLGSVEGLYGMARPSSSGRIGCPE